MEIFLFKISFYLIKIKNKKNKLKIMTTKANEINSINKKISEIHFKIIKK